jgi:ABC-2 type transport system permease protein
MNARVFANALRNGRTGLVWYAIAAFVAVASGGLGLSSIQGQGGAALSEVVKNLPPALKLMFRVSVSSFLTPVTYITARSLNLMVPLVLLAFAAGSAGGVSQLVERGVIHFELSLPIARWRWLLSRMLFGVCGLLLVMLVITGGLYLFADAPWWRYGVYGLAYGLLWMGIAFAVAAFARERGTVTAWVFGLFGLEFIISIVAALSEQYQWLERFSVWSAYRPDKLFSGEMPWGTVLAWLLMAGVGFTISLWGWQKRDLPA